MLYLVLILAAFGIGGFTARTASERGRSGVGWAAFAVAAGILGQILGMWIFGWALGHTDSDISVGHVTLGVLASLLGPLAAMMAVLALVWRLPERVPTLTGARWSVYRLSSKDEPAGDCELAVEAGVLHVGDRRIAPDELTELVADGECLRIGRPGGTTVLMPAGDGRTSKEKAKRSQALEKRLRSLLR